MLLARPMLPMRYRSSRLIGRFSAARRVSSMAQTASSPKPFKDFREHASVPGLFIAESSLSKSTLSRTAQEIELEQAETDLVLGTAKLFNKVHGTFLEEENTDDFSRNTTPYDFESKYHNLSSEEYYRKVSFEDPSAPHRRITGQYFDEYGDSMHTLTYFLGNKNIPHYLRESLVRPAIASCLPLRLYAHHKMKTGGASKVWDMSTSKSVMEFRRRSMADRDRLAEEFQKERIENFDAEAMKLLEWKLTFNTYEISEESKMSGFGFHVDLPSNGEMTTIFSLGRDSTFEIEPLRLQGSSSGNLKDLEDALHSIQVNPKVFRAYRDILEGDESRRVTLPVRQGEMIALTGESRWRWQHRVIPVDVTERGGKPLFTSDGGKDIHRVSLVLGCQ